MIRRDALLTVAPASGAVTLGEAVTHLRADEAPESLEEVDRLVRMATVEVEDQTGRALVTQERVLLLDGWEPEIWLPRPPLQEVLEVRYRDEGEAWQVLDPARYRVDLESVPARLRPAPGERWPALSRGGLSAVRVAYRCGYGGPEDVPEDLRHAVLLLLSHRYDDREGRLPEPVGVRALTMRHRVRWQ